MDYFNYTNASLSALGMGLRTSRVVEHDSPLDERTDLRVLQRRIRWEARIDGVAPWQRVGDALRLQIADMGLDDDTEQLPTPARILEAEFTVKRRTPPTVKRPRNKRKLTTPKKIDF